MPMRPQPAELLDQYFSPRADESQWQSRTSYTDEDVAEISDLLSYTNPTWSRIPRTYTVLRAINKLHELDILIANGFSDHWFPIASPRALPSQLSPTTRAEIFDAQGIILTTSMDLEKGEKGRHLHFGKWESIPFESKEILGSGHYGEVDRVISLISYKEYARKRISRRLAFGDTRRREAVVAFIKEISVLKSLRHQHAVQLIGTYTDSTSFCLLMSPVADMDLSVYLSDTPVPSSLAKNATLRTFFGCLACAVRYLHENGIRHKDIKPQNILVKGKNVLLTDFGISQNHDGLQSTTSGPATFSPRYCAPEVALQESRNYSSDIWSLGCVFLEMTAVLKSWTVRQVHAYFEDEGTQERFIRQNHQALESLLDRLLGEGSFADSPPVDWTREMLVINRRDRPTAATIAEATMEHVDGGSRFCGMCCFTHDDDDEDSLLGIADELEPHIGSSEMIYDSDSDNQPTNTSSPPGSVFDDDLKSLHLLEPSSQLQRTTSDHPSPSRGAENRAVERDVGSDSETTRPRYPESQTKHADDNSEKMILEEAESESEEDSKRRERAAGHGVEDDWDDSGSMLNPQNKLGRKLEEINAQLLFEDPSSQPYGYQSIGNSQKYQQLSPVGWIRNPAAQQNAQNYQDTTINNVYSQPTVVQPQQPRPFLQQSRRLHSVTHLGQLQPQDAQNHQNTGFSSKDTPSFRFEPQRSPRLPLSPTFNSHQKGHKRSSTVSEVFGKVATMFGSKPVNNQKLQKQNISYPQTSMAGPLGNYENFGDDTTPQPSIESERHDSFGFIIDRGHQPGETKLGQRITSSPVSLSGYKESHSPEMQPAWI